MVSKFINKILLISKVLPVFLIFIVIICPSKAKSQQTKIRVQNPEYKVEFIGAPDEPPTKKGYIHMVDYSSVNSWEWKKVCTWLPITK